MAEFSWTLEPSAPASSATIPSGEHDRVFRRIFKRLLPRWLTSGEGELVLYSLGVIKDAFVERARQGLLARYPAYAPDDALPFIGRDRKIVRGIDEPRSSYETRLIRWRDSHRVQGNAFALLEQLRAYCQAEVRIRTVDARGNWYTLERDGTTSYLLKRGNWNWDGKPVPPYWSRFWVIIYPTADGRPWALHDPQVELWSAEKATTIGTTATPAEVASLRGIIRDWQPDGTRCEWIIIAYDDASFDPESVAEPPSPGDWGNWGKSVGGHLVPSRVTTARYFAGVDGGKRGVVT